MPEIKKLKQDRRGGCHECGARFSGKQAQAAIQHAARSGHRVWWVDRTAYEIVATAKGG